MCGQHNAPHSESHATADRRFHQKAGGRLTQGAALHLVAEAGDLAVADRDVDGHPVAVGHERRHERARVDFLDHALFSQTRRPLAAIPVADGSTANNGSSGQRAGLTDVRDDFVEAEVTDADDYDLWV